MKTPQTETVNENQTNCRTAHDTTQRRHHTQCGDVVSIYRKDHRDAYLHYLLLRLCRAAQPRQSAPQKLTRYQHCSTYCIYRPQLETVSCMAGDDGPETVTAGDDY